MKANVARETVDYANEYATFQEVYKGYIEVAKGGIDRSLQRADFVQKVAAAIGTVNAGILALSFSAKDGKVLPVTAVASAIFLGISFVMAATYVSFLTQPGKSIAEPTGGTLRMDQLARRNTFIVWTRNAVLRRRYCLQASVVSLGVGIFFLPAPYISIGQFFWWLVVLGAVLTFLLPLAVERIMREIQE